MRLEFAVEALTVTRDYRNQVVGAALERHPEFMRDVCPDMRNAEIRLAPLRLGNGPERMAAVAQLVGRG